MKNRSILFSIGVLFLGFIMLSTFGLFFSQIEQSQLAVLNQTDIAFDILSYEQIDETTYRIELEILNSNLEWTLLGNEVHITESTEEETDRDQVAEMIEQLYGRGNTDHASEAEFQLHSFQITQEEDDSLESIEPYERLSLTINYERVSDTHNLLTVVFFSNEVLNENGTNYRHVISKTEEIFLD